MKTMKMIVIGNPHVDIVTETTRMAIETVIESVNVTEIGKEIEIETLRENGSVASDIEGITRMRLKKRGLNERDDTSDIERRKRKKRERRDIVDDENVRGKERDVMTEMVVVVGTESMMIVLPEGLQEVTNIENEIGLENRIDLIDLENYSLAHLETTG